MNSDTGSLEVPAQATSETAGGEPGAGAGGAKGKQQTRGADTERHRVVDLAALERSISGSGTPRRTVLDPAVPPVAIPAGDVTAGSARPATLDRAPESRGSNWPTWYVTSLVALDSLGWLMGGLLGQFLRFASLAGSFHGVAYVVAIVALTPAWLAVLALGRTYEIRFLGVGSDEYQRVANAAARVTAVLAVVIFLTKLDVARGLVVVALPAAALFTLLLRYAARRTLHRIRRRSGAASHRVLLVGDGGPAEILQERLAAALHSGLTVVDVCPTRLAQADGSRQVVVDHVARRAAEVGADTVAVVQTPHMTPEVLRRLGWSLEGTGIDLLVAPGLTDVAGPRINIRPVSGLPLLQVASPEYSGARRLIKAGKDLFTAAAMVILLAPLMVSIAFAVRLTSPGPALFRQTRVGKDGKPFPILKFRSMYADAEDRLEELRSLNDHGESGVLFKMQNDPRITPVGRFLRRYSLDELPQLLNVLAGQMSLVGPRPPLPDEVARYESEMHRRLLVKPGLTGLWQVSGRSDLSWDETVRLDLYYVENWSVMLDLEIMWKTAAAVLRGSGAR